MTKYNSGIKAGLFSAAVTAFTVESYKLLEEDANDVSARLLAQISRQLGNLTTNTNAQAFDPSQGPFHPSPSAFRINILWFLSLTLSLATVLVGILCMQWLREFRRDASLPNMDAIALRQMRYEGILKWRVPSILSALPLLLQSAVVLFFAGLLDLLWNLDKTVASLVTVAVGLVVSFLVITTVTPFLQYFFLGDKHFQVAQCAYKSPQSWAFCWLGMNILWLMTCKLEPTSQIRWVRSVLLKLRRSLHDQSWMEHDIRQWRRLRTAEDLVNGLSWIGRTFSQNIDVVHDIYHCLQDLEIPAAAQVASILNPDAADRLHDVLDKSLGPSAPTPEQKRENINASFLELHRRLHPSLTTHYLESIIRILNSQDVRPFMDWPVRDLLTLPDGSFLHVANDNI